MLTPAEITIPPELLPTDGRFGCGPSKIRPEQALALAKANASLLGSSHRQAPVKNLVGRIREQLAELFGLPDGWEVLLGNGGSTLFWDAATFGLIRERSQHFVFGEFSSKFFEAADAAPHLGPAAVVSTTPGTHPQITPAEEGVDLIALTQNETSTGVAMELSRPDGSDGVIVAVDATSGAGGLAWDPAQVDVYYFAPQKCFASDGGLWLAACSPAGLDRIEQIAATQRWTPAMLNLKVAKDNSLQNQTYNTPALATLVLLDEQLRWMLDQGGLSWCTQRTATSARHLYGWAESSRYATPFVQDPAQRSNVVATIDIEDGIAAADLNAALRANGIVDTDSYRKLGRNQLRIAMFPAVDPDDVVQLTRCIDYVVGQING